VQKFITAAALAEGGDAKSARQFMDENSTEDKK
jgi:hypothetical protein